MSPSGVYNVELSTSEKQWWRYNVVITAAGFDAKGNRTGYYSLNEHRGDVGADNAMLSQMPRKRALHLECGACHKLDLYLYIIPHTLPECRDIEDAKPFDVALKISLGDSRIVDKKLRVNPWGGTSQHILIIGGQLQERGC